jgi:hypothetical protein
VTVKELSDLAAQMMRLEDEIRDLEAQLVTKKEKLRMYAQSLLPTSMDAAQVKALTLPDGAIIQVEDFLAANIKKENEAAAFAWLRKNKLDALIKNEIKVKFGKGEDKLVSEYEKFLKKKGIAFERKAAVNWQTLQAFVRERIRAGKDLPPVIEVNRVPTATIKRPKGEE